MRPPPRTSHHRFNRSPAFSRIHAVRHSPPLEPATSRLQPFVAFATKGCQSRFRGSKRETGFGEFSPRPPGRGRRIREEVRSHELVKRASLGKTTPLLIRWGEGQGEGCIRLHTYGLGIQRPRGGVEELSHDEIGPFHAGSTRRITRLSKSKACCEVTNLNVSRSYRFTL